MTRAQDLLQTHFGALQLNFDYPLANKSYFKLGGHAEVFYSATTREQAIALLNFCQDQQIRFTILGGASNVIIADEGLSGLVLELGCKEVTIISDTTTELQLQAEAGIKTSALVAKTTSRSATGLEGFIGVPGVLGGAIYNNAHYLGYLIGDYITQVEVYDLDRRELSIISRENCQFAYEQSIFQTNKHLVILSAFFALKKGNPEEIKERVRQAIAKREREQPLSLPSCGCVFQNPSNNDHLRELFPQFAQSATIPAGFLIDQAGLKGSRVGDIQVSEKHAAFFVNLGAGHAADVRSLVEQVKAAVVQKFGVMLKEEVFYLS